MVDAELVVLGDALGDFLVATHQCGARAGADKAETGPQVRRDDEIVPTAAVEIGHTLLTDRVGLCELALGEGDHVVLHGFEHSLGDRPCVGESVPADDVETDSEREMPTGPVCQLAHVVDALGNLARRLTPGEIDIGVTGGNLLGRW